MGGQRRTPLDEPNVARVHVVFVHWPVGVIRNCFGIVNRCSPEIGDKTVEVVDGLNVGFGGAAEQNSQRPGEGLDIIGHVPEPLPN